MIRWIFPIVSSTSSSGLRSARWWTTAVVLLAGAASAPAQRLTSTEVAHGLESPIGLTSPPGDVRRLFVLERAGRVRIIKDGVLLATPFLDVTSEVSTNGEGGLLGIAFHPDYVHNGRFFVSFVDNTPAEDPLIREYRVSTNPDVADAASGVAIFGPYPHETTSHYSSDLHFGPDGMLFYTLGHGALNAPQDLTIYDGKLLRMDVDHPAPHVPADNPFASPTDGKLDLIWAFGLRNAYRFSFDRLTGDVYLADVGRNDREEIDFQPASVGAPGSPGYMGARNYGWQCMEGTECTGDTDCACDTSGATLVLPVHELVHSGGPMAIIGGYVYRGSAIRGLQGRYFFTEHFSANVWSFRIVNGVATRLVDHSADLRGNLGSDFGFISSFGADANGELYVTCLLSGKVYRIDPATTPCPAPVSYCSTSPNSVGTGAVIGSTGSTSVAAAELVLTAQHCPHNAAGVFFHGTTEVFVPFGNGARCVGGQIVRMPIVHSDANGNVFQAFDFAATPVSAGTTRNFQFYNRDPAAGGANFNLSNGLRVVFCP